MLSSLHNITTLKIANEILLAEAAALILYLALFEGCLNHIIAVLI
jgi:hypothetical protein